MKVALDIDGDLQEAFALILPVLRQLYARFQPEEGS